MRQKLFKKTTHKEFIKQINSGENLTLITTITRKCVLNCAYCYARVNSITIFPLSPTNCFL